MTSSSSCPSVGRGLRALAVTASILAGCAQGATISDAFRGSSSNDGNGGSDGGGRAEGGRRGDGDGDSSSSDGGAHSVSSPSAADVGVTSVTSTSGAVTSAAVTSVQSSSSAAVTSVQSSPAAQTSVEESSSASSGGGPVPCDAPLNPSGDCGPNSHCFPAPPGEDATCGGPAGNGVQYSGCGDSTQCDDIFACFGVVEGEGACCLQFCVDTGDCPGLYDECYFFEGGIYAGGVEYGVCFDGVAQGC